MITDAYAKAKELLGENMESLDKISEYLFEHETITGKEFMKILERLRESQIQMLKRRIHLIPFFQNIRAFSTKKMILKM